MKVDDELIDKLAELSRLEFQDGEREAIKGDLENILSFMQKLDQIDTTDVEPLIYVNDTTNVFREDIVRGTLSKQDVLKNAPLKNEEYILVPKVIDSKSMNPKK